MEDGNAGLAPTEITASCRFEEAIDAAKLGDQHRIRVYLDQFDGDVNLRDSETQGTLLHVRIDRPARYPRSLGRSGTIATVALLFAQQ